MNKIFKALIIGGLLIVLGGILAGIGIAASKVNGKTTSKADTSDLVEYTYVSKDSNITTLDVTLTYEDIKLETTNDKKFSIIYKDSATNPTIIIDEQNNTLSMKSKSVSISNSFFNVTDISTLISENGFSTDDSFSVVISVPASYDGKLYLSTASGDISASDINACEEARFSAVSGNIIMNNLQFEKGTDMSSTSGDISIRNSVFNDTFAVATTSGDVSLMDVSTDAFATAATISGDINLNNIDAKDLQLNSISGSVISNTTSANDIDIETTSGDVNFDKTTIEKSFSASTISGDCKIDFTDKLANYSTNIQTTSGDCNIPDGHKDGGKILDIATTSGDMYVTFAEK